MRVRHAQPPTTCSSRGVLAAGDSLLTGHNEGSSSRTSRTCNAAALDEVFIRIAERHQMKPYRINAVILRHAYEVRRNANH